MKKLFLMLFVLGACDGSHAPSQTCSANIIWESAMTRRNGEPILMEEIDLVTIYVADKVGQHQYDLLFVFDVPMPVPPTHTMNNLPESTFIYMTITDIEGNISGLSREWSYDCVVGKQIGD